ncbi:hypothetical protein SG34_015200 [Thalassomonas viridans]|uniref:Uncharacterized protein n=1 Tax=Thalassomonas viridans TaxID=137584 RepID=A0AAF0C750_9GAMM|nr:hypothetical protein [Thalassomonas viridans]WDE02790.1 hypothetical protein SG34_015200 [Thalassomonas viridans]
MMDKIQSEDAALVQNALLAKLDEVLDPGNDCFSVDAVDDIMRQFHNTAGDEKEKLRKKDQKFVNGIELLKQFIARQGYMPQNTALAFKLIAALLTIVEHILWELKKEKGDPPKPEQPPRP